MLERPNCWFFLLRFELEMGNVPIKTVLLCTGTQEGIHIQKQKLYIGTKKIANLHKSLVATFRYIIRMVSVWKWSILSGGYCKQNENFRNLILLYLNMPRKIQNHKNKKRDFLFEHMFNKKQNHKNGRSATQG